MKLIIHIGPHKTGTTALQKCLFEGREYLSRNAICYPDLEVVQYGHHKLADMLRTQAYSDARSVISEMMEFAKLWNAETIILSSEDFSALRFDSISELRRIVSESEVEITYLQRHPLRQVYSWWQEQVKHGSRKQFPQYFVEGFLCNRPGQLLRPHTILDKWARLFGREAIKCLKYREGKDIVQDVLSMLLKVERGFELASSTDINRSFGPMDVELIRLFNRRGLAGTSVLLDPRFEDLRQELTRRSKRHFRRFDLRSTSQLKSSMDRMNDTWADRFLNLESGEKPIDHEVVRTWNLDPSFWSLNPQLTLDLSRYLASFSGKQALLS